MREIKANYTGKFFTYESSNYGNEIVELIKTDEKTGDVSFFIHSTNGRVGNVLILQDWEAKLPKVRARFKTLKF